MSDCKCYIEHGNGDIEEITQCPLCAAAPDLLAALKNFPVKLKNQTYQQFYNCYMSWDRTYRQTAIEKTEKGV